MLIIVYLLYRTTFVSESKNNITDAPRWDRTGQNKQWKRKTTKPKAEESFSRKPQKKLFHFLGL